MTLQTASNFNPALTKVIAKLAGSKGVSTARYFSIDKSGDNPYPHETVCYHAIASNLSGKQGLGIVFQGYGGFDKGDRWRKATEEDLLCDRTYPFVNADAGHYNKESLEWLNFLLDPEGPFKTLLPHLMETKPEEVQARRAFIFPDVSLIPARLTWCFAIASRLGFANARVLWRYLHLLEKGLSRPMAVLIASGFEHEISAGKPTGKIIMSYTGGFLGVDTTAYAGKFLSCSPDVDKPFKESAVGTYGSSKVFESGPKDLKKFTYKFADWDEVVAYVNGRYESQLLKKAA